MSLTPSRRTLLQAAGWAVTLGPALAACTSHAPQHAVVDPDVALRAAAVARELALLAAYDAVGAPTPELAAQLAPLRAEHVAHLAALQAPLPTSSPSPTASAAPRPAARPKAELVTREQVAAAAHAADSLRASRSLALILASLAASEASHVVALA